MFTLLYLLSERHPRRKMTSHVENLSLDILASIARSIRNRDPVPEIQDMFIDTPSFHELVETWREPRSGLDLLQLAVVCNNVEVVRFLCKPMHHWSSLWGYVERNGGKMDDSPLLLACKFGHLALVKYFMLEEGDRSYIAAECLLSSGGAICYDDTRDISPLASFEGSSVDPEDDDDDDDQPSRGDGDIVAIASPRAKPNCSSGESELSFTASVKTNSSGRNIRTPFEICVDEGHLDCALFLCGIFMRRLCFKEAYILESTPVHWACYVGSHRFLKLLLDSGHQDSVYTRDKQGHTPLHVAAINGEDRCLGVLLRYGANVNAIVDCRYALHMMYLRRVRPDRFLACTKILIKYGIYVNATDLNHNAALDYLAWEYGQQAVPNPSVVATRHIYTNAGFAEESTMLDLQGYQHQLLEMMRLLLDAGASTVVWTTPQRSVVDHTVLHTLLQNTGWPMSSCLTNTPLAVYAALRLFFDYGACPNLIGKSNNTSAFTMLILHGLHEITSLEHQQRVLHLFVMHGADLQATIPPPFYSHEGHADRLWSVYPAVLALQEKHPLPVIRTMFNFMSQEHATLTLRSKPLRTWQTFMLGGDGHAAYRKEWQLLRRQLRSARSLKHCCKVVVMQAMRTKLGLLDDLPLPTQLKAYLVHRDC